MGWLLRRYWLIIIGFVAVVAVVVIVGYAVHESTGAFTIETEVLSYLPSHIHATGESSFDRGHHYFLNSATVTAPEDLWVRGMRFEIKNADDSVLHHAEFIEPGATHPLCPDIPWRNFVAVGEDQMHQPVLDLPEGYALYIPKGTPLKLETMVHNPMPPLGYGMEYYDVSAKLTLSLAEGEEGLTPVEYYILHVADDPCVGTDDGFTFTVPPETEEFTIGSPVATQHDLASSVTFDRDGKIVLMGGHLHGWEGGKYIDVYKNGTLFTRYETVKAPDHPYRYDTPFAEEDLPVTAGDTVSITATYTNTNIHPERGAMGMLGLYFAPATQE